MSDSLGDVFGKLFGSEGRSLLTKSVWQLLSGEIPLQEQVSLIRQIRESQPAIREFAQVWTEARPEMADENIAMALSALQQIAEARLIGLQTIRSLLSDPALPAWAMRKALAHVEAMRMGNYEPAEIGWLCSTAEQGNWSLGELRAWQSTAGLVDRDANETEFEPSFLADLQGRVDVAGDDERALMKAVTVSRGETAYEADARPEITLRDSPGEPLTVSVRFPKALQDLASEVVLLSGFVSLRTEAKVTVATPLWREYGSWIGTIPENSKAFSKSFRPSRKMLLVRCGST